MHRCWGVDASSHVYGTQVPKKFLSDGTVVEDQNCGCRGCASGEGGERNIFGNKYGQYLAAIQVSHSRLVHVGVRHQLTSSLQIARERRMEKEAERGGDKGTGHGDEEAGTVPGGVSSFGSPLTSHIATRLLWDPETPGQALELTSSLPPGTIAVVDGGCMTVGLG
jgi:hypothetical protein